jgi:hypothetical protein
LSVWFFGNRRTKIKPTFIRPLTSDETNGAPYIRVTLAAKATGLGLSVTKRLGTRKFGNADYVLVKAVNAFITGRPYSEPTEVLPDIALAAKMSDAKPRNTSAGNSTAEASSSQFPFPVNSAAGEDQTSANPTGETKAK